MEKLWQEKQARMIEAIASKMDVPEDEAVYMAVSRMHRGLFPGDDGDHGGAADHEILSEDS